MMSDIRERGSGSGSVGCQISIDTFSGKIFDSGRDGSSLGSGLKARAEKLCKKQLRLIVSFKSLRVFLKGFKGNNFNKVWQKMVSKGSIQEKSSY